MKRIILIAAAIVAATVALSACGGSTNTTTTNTTTTPTTPATVNPIAAVEVSLMSAVGPQVPAGVIVGQPSCTVTTATTSTCTAVLNWFGNPITATFALTFTPDGGYTWVRTS